MKKKLLLLLAEHLEKIDPADYTITSYHKDALFHAAQMPEFKKAGLRTVTRANDRGADEPGGVTVMYKGATDIEAASVFFEISNIEARYLFGELEIDVWGNPHKSPCESKREKGQSRDTEWPAWTAARIKCFVRDPSIDYMDRGPKAA